MRGSMPTLVLTAFVLLLASCGDDSVATSRRAVKRYGIPDDLPSVAIADTGIGEVSRMPTAAATSPTPSAPRTPTAPAAAAPRAPGQYAVITVEEGGTIRGVVKLDKPVILWATPVQKDEAACGHPEIPTQRIIFDAATLGVQNAVVYLADITQGKDWEGPPAAEEDERTVLQDQVGCKYVPHVQVARENTQLVVRNSDSAEHNIHGYLNTALNTAFNFGTAANSTVDEAGDAFLERAGKYILKCDIHPWMNAFILVVTHPYHVVTDEQGAFVLENVPPGEYTLACWHEGMTETPRVKDGAISGYTYGVDVLEQQKVTVAPSGEATVEFVLAAPVR